MTELSQLPPPIAACLEPGEDVLWTGRPRPYVFLLRGMPSMFFGATWSILGSLWYHGAGGLTQTPFEGWWKILPVVPLPFIAAGWSFFLYPINLGARARHTWYIVTNRRVMTARWHSTKPVELQIFKRAEMGPPQVIKRFDGLYEVILTRSAQERPFLVPKLESGFFGIPDGDAAAAAVKKAAAN
jgi:hypothetical protein